MLLYKKVKGLLTILFYDIEAFPYYWCVVVVDDETNERHVFEDVESLRAFYKAHYKTHTWVGYNSRQYDAIMLRMIMLNMYPYDISYDLIVVGKKWFQFPTEVVEKYKRLPLKNFDCMLPMKGLKKLEAFRGSSIIETSVPFDLDRPLTRDEKDEVIKYCTHDVLECRKVFYDTKEEYDAHEALITAFELDSEHFNKTKAQLAALILGAKKVQRFDEWEFEIAPTAKIEKYAEVVDWYKNSENHDYKKKLNIEIAGVPHVFAWGGLHGARINYSGEGYFINMDVESYYPSMMIEYNYLSRNVLNPEKFREIRDQRLVFKATKDPRNLPYKIVINGTFGAQKDKFNALYDPRNANSICVSGQILLLDLIEKVEGHCELIQSNTDGILVRVDTLEDVDTIKAIAEQWSERTLMKLEYDMISRVYQKDVNNYVAIPEVLYKKDGKPAWKTKGAYVKQLSSVDFDLPIVNKAIVDELVHGKPIEDTINECNDLIQFQKVVMVSSKYKHALHGFPYKQQVSMDGGFTKAWKLTMGDNCEVLNDRYLRVFATTDKGMGGIYKVHALRNNINKVGDTPDHALVINSDVTGRSIEGLNIDKEYYIQMAFKRIKNFRKIAN